MPFFCRFVLSIAVFLSVGLLLHGLAWGNVEDAVPKGGTGIAKRVCVDGPNVGNLCNEDADCNPGTCFPYNIIDLTVNLHGYLENEPAVPSQQELLNLETYFEEISNLLYDVTDGQMLLGTVIFVVDNGAPDAAVQVQSGTCLGFNCGGQCQVNADCPQGQACAQGQCCEPVFSDNVFEAASCQDQQFPQYFVYPYNRATLKGWALQGGKMTITVSCLEREFCFVHEFMHFISGVRDEYHGHPDYCAGDFNQSWWGFRCFGGKDDNEQCDPDIECQFGFCDPDTNTCTADDSPCNPHADCPAQGNNEGYCRKIVCIDPGPPNNPLSVPGCIMRGSNNNPDSEICYAGNHDQPDFDTAQSQCENKSCWDQFGDEWPTVIKKPAGAPQDGPSPAPVPPQFIVVSNVQGRFVTVVDRSGSMNDEIPRRIDLAVDATKDFVTLLDDDAEYGLASFSYMGASSDPPEVDATKDFPAEAGLRLLDSEADKNQARTAIDDLSTRTGGNTRIGEGLRIAKQMLEENGGQITAESAIILITDGLNNEPAGMAQEDLDDALQTMLDCDLPVYVTCIGEAADSDQCAHIADASNGLFVASEESDGLLDAFIQFAADVQRLGLSATLTGQPIQQAQVAGPFAIYVEEGVERVIFQTNWTDTSTNLDLMLMTPDGTPVSCAVQPLIRGEFCELLQPLAGQWQVSVIATQVIVPDETFSLRGIIDNDRVRLDAGLRRAAVAWPEVFELSATATVGGMLTSGCQVDVVVQRPDGSTNTLTLNDDGLDGDAAGGDGLYQGTFANISGDGDYTFNLQMICPPATVFFPTEPDNLAGDPLPVPPTFERAARFSGNITGAPRDLPPVADICLPVVEVPCSGPLTGVTLDGSCSKDPDGRGLQYLWSAPTGVLNDPASPTPVVLLPPGAHDVFLTVTDASAQMDGPDRVGVLVTDTEAPSFSVALQPGLLWPPNHRMVDVTVPVTLVDNCDAAPTFTLDAILANEPDDAPGASDGATVDDVQEAAIDTPDVGFRLRAERDAAGAGRSYTATYGARDASGNDSTAMSMAIVPVTIPGLPVEPLDIRVTESRAGTVVSWQPVAGAASYDVIRGLVGSLTDSGNAYDLGAVTCIEAASTDESTTGNEDAALPSAGAVFYYLVEFEDTGGAASSYGTESALKPRLPTGGACGP
jgi:hypothetical protein